MCDAYHSPRANAHQPLTGAGIRALALPMALMMPIALSMPGAALADPSARSGNMGGGFIEFLMTGSAPTHRQGAPVQYAPRQHAPMRHAAHYAAPAPVTYGLEDEPLSQPQLAPRGDRQDRAPAPLQSQMDPQYERQEVAYTGPHGAGTLVIDTPNRYLYLVQGNGRALRYGIGVGRPGFEWAGVKTVSRKAEWPDWRPPAEMLKRRPDLPRHMPGGPENPLGARAMYLGSSLYRIHGTNEPETIGRAVSSGCIRMRNQDVTDLYERVRVGAKVIVI